LIPLGISQTLQSSLLHVGEAAARMTGLLPGHPVQRLRERCLIARCGRIRRSATYDLRMARKKSPAHVCEPSEGLTDSGQRVLRQFRQVFNAVKTHFQRVERKAGIGGAQLWALSIVRDHPGRGVNALAAAMDIKQSTTSNLVKGLIERGLIAAERSGPDRRAVQLFVLPPARRVLQRAPGPLSGVLPDALAKLDPQALGRLERDLAALIEALGADQRAATKPLADM